ncbi:hypothetical protein CAMRE0001_1384 [Campylobacter rectus RM3267]|uniref:Uncharacterized protein n=1 Tax=Campylobacter rectus RM3267 TaxID=553218 RepID=B9D068_CAMRE|nr:hypothetical protein CAMRE0001_1384 [Campylobacter rectus RM3267]
MLKKFSKTFKFISRYYRLVLSINFADLLNFRPILSKNIQI